MTGQPPACAIVITTINHPTHAVRTVAAGASRIDATVILIGDEKSPADFDQPGAVYLDLAAQGRTGFRLAGLAPTRHYARKNLGYLEAMRRGAGVIVETDDDNVPVDGFWSPRRRMVTAPCLRGAGWVNVYRRFTDVAIWPRGLPLDQIGAPLPDFDAAPVEQVACPIQQGLADGDPDVDAIYRLVSNSPARFAPDVRIVLGSGSWCPFNSQNTSWWPEAFPLLYLPSHCSFRMTDIWRSLIAQHIAFANGWGVLYTGPTVHQDRNAHDLMRDFDDEIPGYRHNGAIRRALEAVEVHPGQRGLSDGLRSCYRALVEGGWVPAAELALLDAWLADLATVLDPSASRGAP